MEFASLALVAGKSDGRWLDCDVSHGIWWPSNTIAAIVFVVLCHLLRHVYSSFLTYPPTVNPPPISPAITSSRVSVVISDSELIKLVDELDSNRENEEWENVVDRGTSNLSYKALVCKPKDGPLKYSSVTVFEDRTTEFLKDFYMDNECRMVWDKSVVEYKQLEVDRSTGVEIGRIVKKFTFFTPREYILAWRLWEGRDGTFYCFSKNCEHPSAPRTKKYVRVESFISGWRIRKVHERNACEIKMLHQEDAGLNVEMSKLAFSKGVWSYICKMDTALRGYPSFRSQRPNAETGATAFIQKAPPELDEEMAPTRCSGALSESIGEVSERSPVEQSKLFANSLLVLGAILCFSHAHASLAVKVMSYILKRRARTGLDST